VIIRRVAHRLQTARRCGVSRLSGSRASEQLYPRKCTVWCCYCSVLSIVSIVSIVSTVSIVSIVLCSAVSAGCEICGPDTAHIVITTLL